LLYPFLLTLKVSVTTYPRACDFLPVSGASCLTRFFGKNWFTARLLFMLAIFCQCRKTANVLGNNHANNQLNQINSGCAAAVFVKFETSSPLLPYVPRGNSFSLCIPIYSAVMYFSNKRSLLGSRGRVTGCLRFSIEPFLILHLH
jgi:hypothetical protein